MPFDVQKYKLKSCPKMLSHYTRYKETGKDVNYKNTDIDKSKTVENYSIGIDRKDKYKYLKEIISAYDEILPPVRKKKDRVVMTGFVFTVPEQIANTTKEKEYFEHCFDWARYKFGKRNIICAEVHRDEIHEYYDKNKLSWVNSRAHLHMGIVPFVKDKGINCSKFLTRENLKEWHADLDKYIYEKMGIHDLTYQKINGRDHETLKRKSIEAVAKIRDDLTKEIEQLDKIYNAEIENIDRGISEHERKCKMQIESLEKELQEAKIRFNEAKHKMNTEYKTKTEELAKIKNRINNEIQNLYKMARAYELPVFAEKAQKIEKEFNQIINDWER